MFKSVSSKVNFPRQEEQTLAFWKDKRIFERTLEEREGKPLFVLYEGPPTANGNPGIHHVLARIFKDVIPRYKTMKGFYAMRKGGWDTHGLPVELEVEKELHISTKPEIESYGVAEFNARCKDSVFHYLKEWVTMTERIGFWVDMDNPYVTFDNNYIETIWWILRQLWDKDLIYQGLKTAPHCPRCVTTLSSHEVALGYQENTPDPSVFIKFQVSPDLKGASDKAKLLLGGSKFPTYLLAWTTTPWTLPGNTALTVAPDATYALVLLTERDERLVLAQSLVSATIKEPARLLGTIKGSELAGLEYQPLYNPFDSGVQVMKFSQPGSKSLETVLTHQGTLTYPVITGDFVSMEDGTGIVHTAPAFGEVDNEVGMVNGLYYLQPVDLQGKMTGSFSFAGLFVKDADKVVMEDLEKRGLLYRKEIYKHTYPFCWRCDTPLLYYAKSSWYIKTTAVKDKLIENNQKINWYPDYVKDGRFGEWLRNNVDWAISRERYWGTPLPFWACNNLPAHNGVKFDCIGSRQELRAKPGLQGWKEDLDLHRPYIDQITYKCECGETMRRIPEVLDVWFDSGAMPFAQFHYPFENASLLSDGRFPADYICEAVDQTRGWFYSLHAISTLLVGEPCYKNVICLGLILDSKGEKMSKSKGNVVNPWSVISQRGADPLRWYLFSATPPGNSRRFSTELVGEMVRRFFLTLWNAYSFFVTYANIDDFDPKSAEGVKPASELDRWILSEVNQLVKNVTAALENYNPTDACRSIEDFVDGLSNWYIRRSRRRFWRSENDADKLSAYSTLYQCLVTLSKLMAPFAPFLAEELYQNLVRSADASAPDSVHLTMFPEADPAYIDGELSKTIRLAIRLSSLGRAARNKAQIKVRQPIGKALVKLPSPEEQKAMERIVSQILDELNVKGIEVIEDPKRVAEYQVKVNFALLGPKYGRDVPRIAQMVNAADPERIAALVQAKEKVKAGDFELLPEEVQVTVLDKQGYAVAQESGYWVAVETSIPENLLSEGTARELVHLIQGMRRSAGFDIADHIQIQYQSDSDMHEVIQEFIPYIKQETLAEKLTSAERVSGEYTQELDVDGHRIKVGLNRLRL